MNVFAKFYDQNDFLDIANNLKNLEWSLFVDDVPKSHSELSNLNVLVLLEPNEYFGLHDWAIQNQHLFSLILTWSDKVLNNCSNAVFIPFGTTWLKKEQYEINYSKEFKISHLRGNLLKTSGHLIRHEYHDRSTNELLIPNITVETAGNREDSNSCAEAKIQLFGNAQFGTIIENVNRRGYFSEKIMEMFLLKTIPIYWGCSNIEEFFNIDGIIKFDNVDDAIFKINSLTEDFYQSKKDAIEENYQTALKYIHIQTNIINKITEIFTQNNLIK